PGMFARLRRFAGTGFLLACKGVPHSGQNLAVGGVCWPQLGQSCMNGVPHSIQNFALSGFSVPQLVQRMLPLYSPFFHFGKGVRTEWRVREGGHTTAHRAGESCQERRMKESNEPTHDHTGCDAEER